MVQEELVSTRIIGLLFFHEEPFHEILKDTKQYNCRLFFTVLLFHSWHVPRMVDKNRRVLGKKKETLYHRVKRKPEGGSRG